MQNKRNRGLEKYQGTVEEMMTAFATEMTDEKGKESLTAHSRYERFLYYLNEAAELMLEKTKTGNGRKLNSWRDGEIKEASNLVGNIEN